MGYAEILERCTLQATGTKLHITWHTPVMSLLAAVRCRARSSRQAQSGRRSNCGKDVAGGGALTGTGRGNGAYKSRRAEQTVVDISRKKENHEYSIRGHISSQQVEVLATQHCPRHFTCHMMHESKARLRARQ
jgi:hypothetical protein